MAELRIDLRWQRFFEEVDFLGNFPKAFGVLVRIAAAVFVADDGEAFAEGGREFS
jgi:hypothetical protein